jgi:very-short-patch-repair endonuclease
MTLPGSGLEQTLAAQLSHAGLPPYQREFRFHPVRRWRLDFAWPAHKLALEVEGGVFVRGRHSRGVGYTADCEKGNALALLGWRVLRVTGAHIKSGQALQWATEALAGPQEARTA